MIYTEDAKRFIESSRKFEPVVFGAPFTSPESELLNLRVENNSLRTSLAARNAQYWELHEAVTRLYRTIQDEKREEGR